MCVKVVNTGQEILSVKSTVELYNGEIYERVSGKCAVRGTVDP